MFYIGHAAPVATDTSYVLKPVQAVKASAHSIFLLITMGAIIFVGATSTTISWSLGKGIKPKLSPFFLDIY